ncbi:hypothetical protein KKJ01_18340 [Xenorhabdus bovienii]|uniref:Uncharacterized protein n=1 Tax=Xenorhabdus bovienii TaxID=40576 RepID=A0AAJ1JAF3_XENBV|nr:hypothetical protein [Xenorhabdus bovienii]MDE1480125.1 hypothetical protein [Xenorhabdus bovienii]MDE9511807.1 hypothetical protein [Xenorhabdus bovienii]MDE9523449.1 hypothetical protein [Xenorhabdus bovienii]
MENFYTYRITYKLKSSGKIFSFDRRLNKNNLTKDDPVIFDEAGLNALGLPLPEINEPNIVNGTKTLSIEVIEVVRL